MASINSLENSPSFFGLPLFKNVRDRINLKLIKTKTFGSGAVALYYEPGQ